MGMQGSRWPRNVAGLCALPSRVQGKPRPCQSHVGTNPATSGTRCASQGNQGAPLCLALSLAPPTHNLP